MAQQPAHCGRPRIEHIGLWARDLEALCRFYAQALGAEIGPLYENRAKGFRSRFVSFGPGVRLEMMSTSQLRPVECEAGVQRMGLTHVAFSLGSESAVDALTERLRSAGAAVLDGPRRTGDGCYESVVLDPEGNRLELTA
jgi:lactoylglutathione lyase